MADAPAISLVAAVADNGVIGNAGDIPWHLPADLKFFKSVTMGKPVVMGRKTYASIGRPLPGRKNIVITRRPGWHAEGVSVAHSLDEALALAGGAQEVMVIGGAEIYALALPRARRILLTEVHAAPQGDAYFPEFDRNRWREVRREDHPSDERRPAYSPAYSIVTLERVV